MVSMREATGSYRSSESMTASEQLHALIERACDSYRPEPDLGLDLEIAELINSKKANLPREAAVATVRLVNNRNQHVSMLALYLLDILVKNCSFPFHLQVATKEFLNELVRRFPERPPSLAPPPMARILELIHEWKNTLCVTSKHKEDLVHIRDMYRLLSYKGYRFPDYDRRAAAVLNPADTLKSPEELEEEDRAAQAAKLQELIRRGTPKDLAAAQQLMKVMSGAEPDKKPDYEAQTKKELYLVQQRVLMLNDMLNNAKANERFVDGDAFDQIAQRCKQVQPKLQKWIQDAEETNPEQMDRLLSINDLINQVLERYTAYKRGDRTSVGEIDSALLKNLTSTVVSKTGGKIGSSKSSSSKSKAAAAAPNLIDFDDFGSSEAPEASTSQQASSSAGSGLDALAGLTLGGESTSQPPPSSSNNDLFSLDMSSTSGTSSTAPTPTFSWGSPSLATDPSAGGGISLPSRPGSVNSSSLSAPLSPPALVGSAAQPNYHSPAQSSPSTPSVQQAGQTQQTYTQAQTAAKPDPFEDLLS